MVPSRFWIELRNLCSGVQKRYSRGEEDTSLRSRSLQERIADLLILSLSVIGALVIELRRERAWHDALPVASKHHLPKPIAWKEAISLKGGNAKAERTDDFYQLHRLLVGLVKDPVQRRQEVTLVCQ